MKRKEAAKRAEADRERALKPPAPEVITPDVAENLSFAEVLKKQWDEKKKELEASRRKQPEGEKASS